MIKSSKHIWLVLLLASFLPASNGYGQEADERHRLLERQKQLQARIGDLKREQEHLLFRKQMYESDSKYLVLDLSAGRGELRYRNRVLRNFAFSPARPHALPSGALVLTAKEEQEGKKRTLLFGNTLAIGTKQKTGGGRKGGPVLRLFLLRKDITSLYYALDAGSRAFILR